MERDRLHPHIAQLEDRMGLPSGFFDDLYHESDWSLVIKCHAFVEAVVATFLTEATDTRLEDVFSHLQLGGGRGGKLAFAEALELFDPGSIKFARRLSSLRNELVHQVKNVDFTFWDHLSRLDAVERRNLVRDLSAPFSDFETWLSENDAYQFRLQAKLVVHFGVLGLVTDGYYRLHPDHGDHEQELGMLGNVLGRLLEDIAAEEERRLTS